MRCPRPLLPLTLATAGVCLLLSGCAARSDFNRPGAWVEAPGGGAVAYNVRAETKRRRDLYRGRGLAGAKPDGGIIATHAASQMDKPLSSGRGGGLGPGPGGAQASGTASGGA